MVSNIGACGICCLPLILALSISGIYTLCIMDPTIDKTCTHVPADTQETIFDLDECVNQVNWVTTCNITISIINVADIDFLSVESPYGENICGYDVKNRILKLCLTSNDLIAECERLLLKLNGAVT